MSRTLTSSPPSPWPHRTPSSPTHCPPAPHYPRPRRCHQITGRQTRYAHPIHARIRRYHPLSQCSVASPDAVDKGGGTHLFEPPLACAVTVRQTRLAGARAVDARRRSDAGDGGCTTFISCASETSELPHELHEVHNSTVSGTRSPDRLSHALLVQTGLGKRCQPGETKELSLSSCSSYDMNPLPLWLAAGARRPPRAARRARARRRRVVVQALGHLLLRGDRQRLDGAQRLAVPAT
jgi:hypothetical protein